MFQADILLNVLHDLLIDLLCLMPISAISWRPVLVVEESGIPRENHGQATGKLYHLWLRVECTLFCNLQSRARTYAILVIAIGLHELLGNPTT